MVVPLKCYDINLEYLKPKSVIVGKILSDIHKLALFPRHKFNVTFALFEILPARFVVEAHFTACYINKN